MEAFHDELYAFLQSHLPLLDPPRGHPSSDSALETIETHISQVFLTSTRVYKRKKPVNMGFLDYSHLEDRKRACEAEVSLNRRLAPQTYLGVIAVRQGADGMFSLGSQKQEDQVVDYLVEMRRLPQAKMLDVILRQDPLLPQTEIDRLVQVLTEFYGSASVCRDFQSYWRRLHQHCRDNFSDLKKLIGDDSGLQATLAKIAGAQLTFLARRRACIERRFHKGMVRDGHGDLKPEHICMSEPLAIYDCIEFDEAYRLNDVADELGFLSLECRVLGAEATANSLISKMGQVFDLPKDMLAFFRSYRACVRAKVEAFKQPEGATSQQSRQYLEFAAEDADQLGPPLVLVVGGFMGTGKSTLSLQLCDHLGLAYLSTDDCRSKVLGPATGPNRDFGEGRYQPSQRDRVYEDLFARLKKALKNRRGCLLDASFMAANHRRTCADMIAEAKAQGLLIWLDAPLALCQSRVAERLRQGATTSEAQVPLMARQRADFQGFEKDEKPCYLDGSMDASKLVDQVLLRLQNHPPNIPTPMRGDEAIRVRGAQNPC